ncbi:hypothetical protein [Deinococcus apachensis]|uniref:hypothetical protein n=1 Tax=Deinococcus apachensis TaxID=309886 RepID=UPI0003A187F3|nr:hypothetical protein [Deinococcus apachensis]
MAPSTRSETLACPFNDPRSTADLCSRIDDRAHDVLYTQVFPEHLDPEFTFIPHVTLGRAKDRAA